MEVRFQRANHRTGNESLVLKFDGVIDGETACVLVDAGRQVDVDALLGPGESLVAVLCTHAHDDHVRSLAATHRDDVPVLASEPTTAVLDTALADADRSWTRGDPTGVRDAFEPLTGWRSLAGDGQLRVAPLPAGHAPGATAFVVQFREADVARNLLVTGDFTTTDAAGSPGLPTELPLDVEAMVVNVATTGDYGTELTATIERLLERAVDGERTLATANELTAVHLARDVAAVASRFDLDATVRLAGTPARIYDALDLSTTGVSLHPSIGEHEGVDASDFDSGDVDAVDDVLAPGDVTFAEPDTSATRAGGRLAAAARRDPDGTVVEIATGSADDAAGIATGPDASTVRAHPSEAEIDEVVAAFDPLHVVVGHAAGSTLDAYKDKYAAFVWANQDANEQTLYADGEWRAPPWVSDRAERYVYGHTSEHGGDDLAEVPDAVDVDLPSVEGDDVSLHAEGLDVARLRDRFESEGGDASDDGDAPSMADLAARLDRIEATLLDGERSHDRVPVDVVETEDGTALELPEAASIEDADDVAVYIVSEPDGSSSAGGGDDRSDRDPTVNPNDHGTEDPPSARDSPCGNGSEDTVGQDAHGPDT
jgi:putative mRNA 3-end processing factor